MSWEEIDNNKRYQNKNKEMHIQNLKNKKIYFDSDGTEVKIGYDEETGTGFVELITE